MGQKRKIVGRNWDKCRRKKDMTRKKWSLKYRKGLESNICAIFFLFMTFHSEKIKFLAERDVNLCLPKNINSRLSDICCDTQYTWTGMPWISWSRNPSSAFPSPRCGPSSAAIPSALTRWTFSRYR